MSRVLGIVGWPVEHSRSPAMHGAAIAALGLDAYYVPFAVEPKALGEAIRGLRALGVEGVNVTLPHKQTVIEYLDEVDDDARTIGAVNTLRRDGTRWIGLNTDAPGMVQSLLEAGVELAGKKTIIVGAGGAARAAVVGLARARVASITLAARRPDEATRLLLEVRSALKGCAYEATDLGTELRRAASGADVLIQATSATLGGREGAEEFAKALPIDALPEGAAVMDMVYDPLETSVLRVAKERGLRTVDGLGMLLHQGALAFEIWTGQKPPIEIMRQALIR